MMAVKEKAVTLYITGYVNGNICAQLSIVTGRMMLGKYFVMHLIYNIILHGMVVQFKHKKIECVLLSRA